jgi:hypothetical protein
MSQETVAAQDMLTRFAHWQGREPESVAADTTLWERGVLAMVGGSEHHSLICEPAIVSIERGARSTVQSDLPISLKATAISVLQASPLTTAAEVIATVP